jgi:hypothetical protein
MAVTLADFAQAEATAFEANRKLAGDYAMFAEESVTIFASMIVRIDRGHQLFMAYYSAVRKASICATLSALRQHKVQSSLNLRQAIEGTVLMTYALMNPRPEILEGVTEISPRIEDKLSDKARKWLAGAYPPYSEKLKLLKDNINETDSHANLINTYATFDFDSTEKTSRNRFLDRDDEDHLKITLWTVGHTMTHLAAAYVDVALDAEGIEIAEDFRDRIAHLSKVNDALIDDVKRNPRWEGLFD